MTFTTQAGAARTPARKSPLRVAGLPALAAGTAGETSAPPRGELPAPELRQMMISEFCDWLRSRTNRHGRPFQADTVSAYREAAAALNAWMTRCEIDADFTGCDAATLNRFFASYLAGHGQGGTNTKQRNLRHLFTWLEDAYDHPHPYTADLHRYSPAKARPSTLAREFVDDLLEITGGGRARDFEKARDHALIRVLREGVRRTELIQVQTSDLPVDVIAQPLVRVVPLKGARGYAQGRLVPLPPATALALVAYLRARRSHRRADSPALWLGTRNRGPMTGSGLYRMLKRRAEQAGYEPAVHPHQFRHILSALFPCSDSRHRRASGSAACAVRLPPPRCRLSRNHVRRSASSRAKSTATRVPPNTASAERRHAFANDWLEGEGAEGDLMQLMGWTDRSMLDRYGADLAAHRAIEARRRRGDL